MNGNEGLKKFNVHWNIVSTVTRTVYAKDFNDAKQKAENAGLCKSDLADAELLDATPVCADDLESGELMDFAN